MTARTHHPAIKSVTFTPTGQTAVELEAIRARAAAETKYRSIPLAAELWTAEKPRWTAPLASRHVYDTNGMTVAVIPHAGPHQSQRETWANADAIAAVPKMVFALEAISEEAGIEVSGPVLISAETIELVRCALAALKGGDQ